MTYACDIEKPVILGNFDKRGWELVDSDDHWNIFWASVNSSRMVFNRENGVRLGEDQLISHFPNHYELTRKDLLIKNIKRYRREMEKDFPILAERDSRGVYLHLNLIPVSYILPQEYSLFIEEFKKNQSSTWIIKPSGKSRGIGIFLMNKLSQIRRWSKESKQVRNPYVAHQPGRDCHIISRYIDKPLLIGGKKFDLRLYVLVTSFRPLKCFIHKFGFCRFCTEKYNSNTEELGNMFVHLTNVSIQKHANLYNNIHGGKWTVENFRFWLEGTKGREVTTRLFDQIHWLIVHSLKAVSNVIINDKHSFECYGYDIIVDENLKPWLIEVNASPSLSATTASDRINKYKLINDIINVVVGPTDQVNVKTRHDIDERQLGAFQLLLDETKVPALSSLQLFNGSSFSLQQRQSSKGDLRPSTAVWR